MKSFGFPEMLESSRVNMLEDYDATLSNLKLLLKSQKTSLYGDPYYGTNLKSYLFSNSGSVLKNILVDDIYTAIAEYMPQVKVQRSDIDVYTEKDVVKIAIRATNTLNYTTNLYKINLTDNNNY